MKKGPLTADEVRHLDHRWCVLESIKDAAAYKSAIGHSRDGRIYRGCLDGGIATCRALCERFSIVMNTKDWKTLQPTTVAFKAKVRKAMAGASDSECESLWKVLVAANRCVCHLEDKLLDHEVGDKELKEAASLVQAIIRAELKAARLSSLICQ